MFTKIKNRFRNKPTIYYAFSIAATWAGVSSIVNSMTMLSDYGVIPFVLWSIGNTLACIVFGLIAPIVPKLRQVFWSKPMRVIVSFLGMFQIWLSMSGIQTAFAQTSLPAGFGMYLAYVLAAVFIVILMRYGMIRNVLTDDMSWTAVYGVAALIIIIGIVSVKGVLPALPIGADSANVKIGVEKALLLVPGCFIYPYFFEILEYNDSNTDGTRKINVKKAFVIGGLLFGAYLVFVGFLAWVPLSPALMIIRAILITLVAVSTLSSFLYSIYLTFGRNIGLITNICCVVFWQVLIPLKIMDLWTFMGNIRLWVVLGSIAVALIWNYLDKRKAVAI